MTNLTLVVKEAIQQTKAAAADYWQMVLSQRLLNKEMSAGSFFIGMSSPDELEQALLRANWTVHEGALEDGKLILVTKDFAGKEGLLKLSEVEAASVVLVNPKQIEGREEQAIMVADTSMFKDVTETFLIISTFNPQTQTVDPSQMFIPTVFPGSLIGPNDTLVGGTYVKMIVH